ncbi:hypothetical protein PC116_g23502 [Phytophthora cactorum]|nr:hypothetical protein PC116_g23502 [Phytophthora cactorum]
MIYAGLDRRSQGEEQLGGFLQVEDVVSFAVALLEGESWTNTTATCYSSGVSKEPEYSSFHLEAIQLFMRVLVEYFCLGLQRSARMQPSSIKRACALVAPGRLVRDAGR